MIGLLITSISKKIPLIQSVKKAIIKASSTHNIQIKLFGSDSNPDCIGKYFVPNFWHTPKDEDLTLEMIIDYCKENNIHLIIPTRDNELQFYADNFIQFCENGIYVMISESNSIGLCQDKLMFSQYLEHNNLPFIPTAECINDLEAPSYIIKENYGGHHTPPVILSDPNKIIAITTNFNYPIVQPYIEGIEISVDMYITKNDNLKGIILRTRDEIIDGESKITTTFRSKKIEDLFTEFVKVFNFYGHIIAQAIIDKGENVHILEVNCRFGGASPLSLYCGLDSFYWFILEAHGIDLDKVPFNPRMRSVKMIKYDSKIFIEGE